MPGKCLSDSANEINRRKLLINAEVTAITTLIELIGGVTLIIHLYFKKGTTFSTFLHTIVIKCAVMPYAFLMNTSHNKDRIIEKGWKNVLMNIFNHPWFAFFIQKSIVTFSNNTKDETINSKAPKNSRISPKKEIFKISSAESENEAIKKQCTLKSLPCSNQRNSMKNRSANKVDKEVPILDINKLGKQKYIECMSYKLVAQLESNLDDEKLYLESFKKLLKFTENC